jgi:hypothetical protein
MPSRRRIIDLETSTYRSQSEFPLGGLTTIVWNRHGEARHYPGQESKGTTIWEVPDNLENEIWYVREAEHPLLEQARIRAQMGALIKLWHDDVREPPDNSWLWARDNADAMIVLGSGYVIDVLSMDHDLGGADIPLETLKLYGPGGSDRTAIVGDETGVELAEYIGRNDLFPGSIIIHSMNSVGAGNILAELQKWASRSERNCLIRVEPFSR